MRSTRHGSYSGHAPPCPTSSGRLKNGVVSTTTFAPFAPSNRVASSSCWRNERSYSTRSELHPVAVDLAVEDVPRAHEHQRDVGLEVVELLGPRRVPVALGDRPAPARHPRRPTRRRTTRSRADRGSTPRGCARRRRSGIRGPDVPATESPTSSTLVGAAAPAGGGLRGGAFCGPCAPLVAARASSSPRSSRHRRSVVANDRRRRSAATATSATTCGFGRRKVPRRIGLFERVERHGRERDAHREAGGEEPDAVETGARVR